MRICALGLESAKERRIDPFGFICHRWQWILIANHQKGIAQPSFCRCS
jgi:hypothetical protein